MSEELIKPQPKPYLWKPGQSGNPGGRPKTRHIKLSLEKIWLAHEPHDEKDVTRLDAINYKIRRLIDNILEQVNDPEYKDVTQKALVLEGVSKAMERIGLRLEGP